MFFEVIVHFRVGVLWKCCTQLIPYSIQYVVDGSVDGQATGKANPNQSGFLTSNELFGPV